MSRREERDEWRVLGRAVSKGIAVILFLVGLSAIGLGVGLREFALFAVFLVGGGALIVVEAVHLFFTGRIV